MIKNIGHFIGGLFIQQLLEKPGIEFDARKFEYIGVPAQDNYVTAVSKTTGVTGMQQWLAAKTPLKIGGIAPGTATSDIPRLLMAAIDLPAQVVDGYKGTADVRLAFNSGEIVGVTNAWESFKSTWRPSTRRRQGPFPERNAPILRDAYSGTPREAIDSRPR